MSRLLKAIGIVLLGWLGAGVLAFGIAGFVWFAAVHTGIAIVALAGIGTTWMIADIHRGLR